MLMEMGELTPLLQPMEGEVRASGMAATGRREGTAAGAGLPIWVDFDRSVLDREQTLSSNAASQVQRRRHGAGLLRAIKALVSPPKLVTRANIERLMAGLRSRVVRPYVLVIGGGTVGQGLQPLYDAADIQLIAFDIYATPNIHFVADAHAIPLRDGSVDAVVAQAVLEHVLEPATVVEEIWRVLKPEGLVYAETPFLQHVHEGAYDFTRFTESGHRYLFRKFELVASGVCGGPGTQLLWSIDYFARCLFRSRQVGKAFKLAFFWLQWFDRLIPYRHARDAASGFFLLGRRAASAITPREVIRFYEEPAPPQPSICTNP
jgi:SAM-dependent methyltransferase